ncbi:hypothetical protein PARPLA_02598 [Rhodobacteraceae bacterium THAF1]|uniref:hypothetical protein n=1 Tax=Palleronia sp. THAF1 TaxID=2587842 RepID=UPI000F3CFC8B|nr:hypothetical protein [Palleronia sp. THAF1]QFU08077.1 hypothetical protein FIU81_05265 [Palleronia sp. THAF1]VDC27935.1 hypothetical protein PARPLA_02598 [Rhodobacteraceae bacterium THAF1]
MSRTDYPETPDGRYFVSKGRLWRKTDPRLDDSTRRAAVKRLMQARRAVGQAETEAETTAARARVDEAKRDLGERGPVWWNDDAPDQTQKAPKNSTYADWWADLSDAEKERGT